MSTTTWTKPLPTPTAISAPFWDGLKAQQVRLQQCESCGSWIFFPRAHCPTCASAKLAWRNISGEGTLYTYTVARVPTLPEFSDEMPQLLAVVQLDEGPHLNTSLVGVDAADLKIGMRVRPVFDERPGTTTLLRYTATGSTQPRVITAVAQTAAAPAAAEVPQLAKRQVSCKDIEAMQTLVSDQFCGWSNEFLVSQDVINQFAALSGDDYWIHTDVERSRTQSPFGTTIAQGALVQVLTSQLKMPLAFEVTGYNNMVNYGSDRLRFPTPVPAGCRIHGRARVKAVEQVKSGMQLTLELNIHIVGNERPSVINDLVILYM